MSFRLSFYASIGNLPKVKELIERGINPNENECSALAYSAQHGHIGVVKYLMDVGIYPNDKNRYAFHSAINGGNLEIVKYLYIKGFIFDYHGGSTSLNNAIIQDYFSIVKFLIIEMGILQYDHHTMNKIRIMMTWGNFYNRIEVCKFLLISFPKIIRYAFLKDELSEERFFHRATCKKIYFPMLQPGIILERNLRKEKVLKFILKPMSQHMQLTSIE
jgi:hypothetical protein